MAKYYSLVLALAVAIGFHSVGSLVAQSFEFYYLGTVQEKSFYAESINGMSCTDAKAFCKNVGMQLASITSLEQLQRLNDSYNDEKFSANYWINGFTWDAYGSVGKSHLTRNLNFSGNTITKREGQDLLVYCLSYSNHVQLWGIYPAYCEARYHVICELEHK